MIFPVAVSNTGCGNISFQLETSMIKLQPMRKVAEIAFPAPQFSRSMCEQPWPQPAHRWAVSPEKQRSARHQVLGNNSACRKYKAGEEKEVGGTLPAANVPHVLLQPQRREAPQLRSSGCGSRLLPSHVWSHHSKSKVIIAKRCWTD